MTHNSITNHFYRVSSNVLFFPGISNCSTDKTQTTTSHNIPEAVSYILGRNWKAGNKSSPFMVEITSASNECKLLGKKV